MNRLIEALRTKLNEKKDFDAAVTAGFAPIDREQCRKFNWFRA